MKEITLYTEVKEVATTDITEMADEEIDALLGVEDHNGVEDIVEKFAGAAMELYKRDNKPLIAMKFLEDARKGCMCGRGDWARYDVSQRKEIMVRLKNNWRAIAVHNAGLDDLFRSA